MSTDERIDAWDAIARHPFFRDCYETDGPLITAMLTKLSGEPHIEAGQRIPLEEIEAAAEAEFSHVRANRPTDHGSYLSWADMDESYRAYVRAIAQAGLEAARRVRES